MQKEQRLQEYAVGIFIGATTRSALKKAIKKKRVLVNGKIAATATYIRGGETITLCGSVPKAPKKPFHHKLEIVYEDDFLAAIYKPAGLLVSGNSFKTVTNALRDNLVISKQPDTVSPQPVHRLDYPTTGLLLIGKTSTGIIALNRLFEKKEIIKTYFAVTIGKMKKKGIIDSPIDGKKAITQYTIVDSVPSKRFEFLNLVELSPNTGRRHQLRNHLASIANPILGDADYGMSHLTLKGKGLYLHAFSLEFIHPFTKEKLNIKTELPKKFKKIFKDRP